MRKDDKRLDLNADLENAAKDFLKDVEAATKEVKQRKEADAEKDRRRATKRKDQRISLVVIGVATVVLVLVAWMVFARPPAEAPSAAVAQRNANPPVGTTAQPTSRQATPRLTPPVAQNSQQPVPPPPNEYEDAPPPQ